MKCPKCPHCQKLEWSRKVREFNKKHSPKFEIDDYHSLLYNDGEVMEDSPHRANYNTQQEFIDACEKLIGEK